jgi:hypothetical protein
MWRPKARHIVLAPSSVAAVRCELKARTDPQRPMRISTDHRPDPRTWKVRAVMVKPR